MAKSPNPAMPVASVVVAVRAPAVRTLQVPDANRATRKFDGLAPASIIPAVKRKVAWYWS